MSKLLSIKPSKDGKAVIIGGKRYPSTPNNIYAWREYKLTGDKKQLRFKLSTVVLDI